MKKGKDHIRYHRNIENNQVASVYIDEVYLKKMSSFSDDACTIRTGYYEYIGIIIGKCRRLNNDWWNGDKVGNKVHNKSTGKDIRGLIAIFDELIAHVLTFINNYGCYCAMVSGTDERRVTVYHHFIKRLCKQCNLEFTFVDTPEGRLYHIF